MSLEDEHVHECRLSVVEVACDDDVPHHVWVVHHVEHEPLVEPCGRELVLALDNVVLSLLDGRDDRLGQQLGVLLLDERLDILPVRLLGSLVVPLVLVQNDRRPRSG